MIIPVKCFTCGKVLADKYNEENKPDNVVECPSPLRNKKPSKIWGMITTIVTFARVQKQNGQNDINSVEDLIGKTNTIANSSK